MTIRDGDWELFEYDYATGRSVWRYYDGEKTVFRTDYPVAQLVEQNAVERSHAISGWKGDWHKIGSVPSNMAWENGLVEAVTQQDDKWISRMLNDSDNRAWRTKEGRV
ncbi:hypothetical protein [Agrobacterium rubi]|uniref:Uncharacterized protein n=1 Tax=Agrobacterium rubi TaxID=28099 RepID=A0ABX2J1Z5_9HYPH|nr:hypothetical protein [Agrobacterium rubi]NTF35560.1 hypothetical protein [Agrobacterium rubi]